MLYFVTQYLFIFSQMQVLVFYYDTVDPYYVKRILTFSLSETTM